MKYTSDNIVFNSLIFAIYINCQAFNKILGAFIAGFANLGLTAVFIGCFSAGVLSALYTLIFKKGIPTGRVSFFIPAVVTGAFYLTNMYFPGLSSIGWQQIITYIILPFLLVFLEYDFIYIIKWSLLITSPAILAVSVIFPHTYHNGITIGLSYAFLPSVLSAVVYLFCIFKKDGRERGLFLFLCGISAYYFYQILFFGSRTPSLTVFLACLVLYFLSEGREGIIRVKHVPLFVIVCFILILILVFRSILLEVLNSFFVSKDMYVRFITKNYNLLQKNDLLNNRSNVYGPALKGIADSPLRGHGLSMFEENTGIVYPHNLVLQLLYDGGIVLACLILIPLLTGSICVLRTKRYDFIIHWLFFFFVSVPGAMLSFDTWEVFNFWMFTAVTMKLYKKIRHNKRQSLHNNYSLPSVLL